MSNLKMLCIAVTLCFSTVVYATPKNIEIDSKYILALSDILADNTNKIESRNYTTVVRGYKTSEGKKSNIHNVFQAGDERLKTFYNNDYQLNNIFKKVNAATADLISFGKMYPGMPEKEFALQVEWQLCTSGWREQSFVNGVKFFAQRVDSNFVENIIYNPMENIIAVTFITPSKIAADNLFKLAFDNLCRIAGVPQKREINDQEEAVWEKEIQPGKQYKTEIICSYNDGNYRVGIVRHYRNKNADKHWQFTVADTLRQMSPLKGDWYDSHGNKILSITDGYVNGCKVIGGFDFIGGRGQCGIYRIMENAGPRDIKIERMTLKMILVDNRVMLTSTPKEEYYESVNGIHLGMAYSDVVAHLGKPDSIINENNRKKLEYNNLGLSVIFTGDRVIEIEMKNNGKWFLNQSNLNYRNSLSDYCKAYNFNTVPEALTYEERRSRIKTNLGRKIANYEYLWFDYYPDVLTLSIWGY